MVWTAIAGQQLAEHAFGIFIGNDDGGTGKFKHLGITGGRKFQVERHITPGGEQCPADAGIGSEAPRPKNRHRRNIVLSRTEEGVGDGNGFLVKFTVGLHATPYPDGRIGREAIKSLLKVICQNVIFRHGVKLLIYFQHQCICKVFRCPVGAGKGLVTSPKGV